MQFRLKMKTGFYKTTCYALSIFDGGIQLLPAEDKTREIIRVMQEDLIAVTLMREKRSEIQIKTRDQIFAGTFIDNFDLRDVQHELRKHISSDVIYVER